MDGQGFSIFQGVGSIQMNTSFQKAQEQEELEDKKRRDAEIGDALMNAFDDIDSIDDTVDQHNNNTENSFSFENHNHLANFSPQPPLNQHKQPNLFNANPTNDNNQFLLEINRLKNIIDSNKNVMQLLQEERKNYQSNINELTKRLALSDAEKERANMTQAQTHELLVESKTKISEQDDVILKLKAKMKNLENAKNELITELDNTKTMLSDANQKYQMVEKTAGTNANKQFDNILRQTNERHSAQIDMMQQQIDNLRSKLDDNDAELRTFDLRYKELQRSREALMIEKAETINQLSKTIDESQRQCQQLMANSDAANENVRLRTKITALEQQTQDMQKTINNLTHRLEQSNSDQLNTIGSPSQFGKNRPMIGSTPLPNHSNKINSNNEELATLKNELNRCMISQREKRDEIKRLEQQLLAKNDEIKRIKDDENKALVEMMLHKDEASKLSFKLKSTQNQLDDLTKNYSTTELTNQLHETNRQLQIKCENIEQEYCNLQHDYDCLTNKLTQITNERDEATEKYHEYLVENENLRRQLTETCNQNDIADIKMELEKEKFLLNDARTECERLKNLYCEVSGAKDQITRELMDLRKIDVHKELYAQREKVVTLERALQLCEMKCSEFKKMLEREKCAHQQTIEEIHQKQMTKKCDKDDSKNSTTNCSKCISQITEIAKFEIENLQLQNSGTNYLKEINDLRATLEQSKSTINELQQKILLKEEHDHLLADLKQKATQFENYIRQNQNNNPSRTQSSSSPSSSSESTKITKTSRDQSCSTSPELLKVDRDKSFAIREKKIRDDSGKVFAAKLKSIEDKHLHEIDELKENANLLRLQLDECQSTLQIRSSEVQILKQAILSEREKITEILNRKDNETKQLFDKQNAMLRQSHNEIDNAQQKIEYLTKELEDSREQFNAQLKSMQKLLDHRLDENKILIKSEENFKEMLTNLKIDKEKVVEQLNAKYQSAKKIAAYYEKYSEEKDKFIAEQDERIKLAYEAAVKKAQEKAELAYKERLQKLTRDRKN